MNPYDILKYGQSFLHDSLRGLPDAEWETPDVCGVWSTKDILSHLVSYECMLEDILNSFVRVGSETPTLSQMFALGGQAFNDAQVAQRQATPPRDVLRELDETHRRVLALVPQIPPETWRQNGTLPWYGEEYSLEDYIVYSFYGHKREHGAQINVFKDQLKARAGS